MSLAEIQKYNAANNDWYVTHCDQEMVSLKCRDTGAVSTMHVQDLILN